MSIESMNNIFQISINEKKLHRILSELQEAYKRHSSLISLLEIKMKRMEEKQEFSKNDVKDGQQKLQSQVENLATELHSFPDYVSEAKLIEEVHKWESEYQVLNSKIGNHLERDQFLKMTENLRNQMSEALNGKCSIIQKDISSLRERVENVDHCEEMNSYQQWVVKLMKDSKFLDFIQILIDRQMVQTKISKSNSNSEADNNEYVNPLQTDKKKERHHMYSILKKDILNTQQFLKKLKNKVNKSTSHTKGKSKNSIDVSALQYAAISAKLNEIQIKMQEKHVEKEEKVLYPTQKNKMKRRYGSVMHQGEQLSPLQAEQKKVMERLVNIEEDMRVRVQNIQNKIEKIMSTKKNLKADMENSFDFLQKEYRKQQQFLKLELRRVSDLNLQNYQMRQIHHSIKRVQEKCEEMIDKKVEKIQMKNGFQTLEKKMGLLSEELGNKSNKDEIRKAFYFIQQKIKQIVLILSDIENKKLEVAGTKKLIKCLSCENILFEQGLQKTQKEKTLMTRCSTARAFPASKNRRQCFSSKRVQSRH